MTVTEAVKKNVPIWGDFVARTAANEEVELRARVEGFLEKVNFDTGEKVKAGEVVFEIEKSRYMAAVDPRKRGVAKAESDLFLAQKQVKVLEARGRGRPERGEPVKAKQDVERIRPLVERNGRRATGPRCRLARESVAQAGVDASKAALQNAELTSDAYIRCREADVLRAKANLQPRRARSRIHDDQGSDQRSDRQAQRRPRQPRRKGRQHAARHDREVQPDPGALLDPGDRLPPAEEARRNRERGDGAQGKLAFELLLADGTQVPAARASSAASRRRSTPRRARSRRGEFPNPDLLLKPGQFGRVRVVLEEREGAILIPQRSVVEIQGAQMALVVGARRTRS